jgi:hypothetical protein
MKVQDKFYFAAANAFHRCYSPKNKRYSRYGGRGITVQFASRDELADYIRELPGYEQGKTLDRIDNDGNYAPGNLRWATISEQNANTGMRSNNTSGIKGLSRHSNGKGWAVKIAREGHEVRKSFADNKFGGTEQARLVAISYLEELRNQPN